MKAEASSGDGEAAKHGEAAKPLERLAADPQGGKARSPRINEEWRSGGKRIRRRTVCTKNPSKGSAWVPMATPLAACNCTPSEANKASGVRRPAVASVLKHGQEPGGAPPTSSQNETRRKPKRRRAMTTGRISFVNAQGASCSPIGSTLGRKTWSLTRNANRRRSAACMRIWWKASLMSHETRWSPASSWVTKPGTVSYRKGRWATRALRLLRSTTKRSLPLCTTKEGARCLRPAATAGGTSLTVPDAHHASAVAWLKAKSEPDRFSAACSSGGGGWAHGIRKPKPDGAEAPWRGSQRGPGRQGG